MEEKSVFPEAVVPVLYLKKAFGPLLHKKLHFCKKIRDVAEEYFVMAFFLFFDALCTSLSKLYKTKNFVHWQFAIILKFDLRQHRQSSHPPNPHHYHDQFGRTFILFANISSLL